MNKKRIITAGHLWNDIDAYASAIAYQELCELLNIEAEVVLSGPMNESVTKSVKTIKADYKTELVGNPEDFEYVMVDLSDPGHFSKFVIEDRVIELYDHHWGFQDHWRQKLGDQAKIQVVGACATLIWEEFKQAGVQDKISKESALLLYTAIISNTLNLHADITQDSDRLAIKELHHYAQIPEKWIETYYEEASASVFSEPEKAMKNDTKILKGGDDEYGITQIELWESQPFINEHLGLIKKVLSSLNTQHTFFTSPNIAHNFNYIITEDEFVKNKLTERIQAEFNGEIGKTKRLWLRKEIIKALAE